MSLIQDLAKEKAQAVPSRELAWRNAFERLASTGLSEVDLRRVARACQTPRQASRLGQLLRQRGEEGYRELVQAVDESDYTLESWLAALEVFYNWLDEKGRSAQITHALGYIHCCTIAESANNLSETVRLMLEEHGYQGVD